MSYGFIIVSTLILVAMIYAWISRYAPSQRNRWMGIIGITLLTILSALLGATGVLTDLSRFPPPFAFYIAANFLLIFTVILSPWGRSMALATPVRVLVGLQAFRILPEVFLHLSWKEGLAPIQMTFHGLNYDIVTAIAAIVLFVLWPRLPRPRLWAWLHTVGGLGLVTTIVTISILSSPVPFRVFMEEPANTFVTRFPFIWLPGIHVFAAYCWHGLAFRKLISGAPER